MAIVMQSANVTNEYRGLSSDEKPVTNVPNGSLFYEFDTVRIYAFDAENEEWILQTK